MRPTTEQSAEVEHRLLTTEGGLALLREFAKISKPTPADMTRWRKTEDAETVSAALRIVESRRKGALKFTKADRMWFEPIALEQSTSEAVAEHKAKRFAGADVFDLCCGIGGDSLSLAQVARHVVAVDRDFGMLRRMRFNAEVYGCGSKLLAVTAIADSFPISRDGLVHIDPDRRTTGTKRAKKLAEYSPDIKALRRLMTSCRGGAIKLGPASDFSEYFGHLGEETEVVSLNGECKEATVWFGSLATCSRRATTLPSGATWTEADGHVGRISLAELGPFLFEPDPALTRSGLLESFARSLGLFRFLEGIDLLTGGVAVNSPFLTTFAVESEMPMDRRLLRTELNDGGFRPYEVKTRGLGGRVVEEALQEYGRGEGDPVTLFLLKGTTKGRAIVTRRLGKKF